MNVGLYETGCVSLLLFDNFLFEFFKIVGYKRNCQSAHFVENYTQRPNISLLSAGAILPQLRRKVKRCAYLMVRMLFIKNVTLVVDLAGSSQVAYLGGVIFSQEYIE